jgi:hypothetical protein
VVTVRQLQGCSEELADRFVVLKAEVSLEPFDDWEEENPEETIRDQGDFRPLSVDTLADQGVLVGVGAGLEEDSEVLAPLSFFADGDVELVHFIAELLRNKQRLGYKLLDHLSAQELEEEGHDRQTGLEKSPEETVLVEVLGVGGVASHLLEAVQDELEEHRHFFKDIHLVHFKQGHPGQIELAEDKGRELVLAVPEVLQRQLEGFGLDLLGLSRAG